MGQSLAIPRVIPDDWKRLDLIVNKIKLHLGRNSNQTFAGLTLTGLTASALIGANASKALESVTIGTGLNYTRPTLSLSHLGIESLTDPGGDRILFWDDSETACKWLGVGNSIAITTTTVDAIQDIRTTASPTFANLSLGTGELTCGSINRAAGTLTIEIGGTAEISISSATVTLGGNLIIPDAGQIGSVSDPDAVTISATGIVDVTSHDGSAAGLSLGGTLVTSTAAELNLLDGLSGVQAQGDVLDDLNTLGTNPFTGDPDADFLVGTAAGTLAWQSGATVRTSIGLGNVENTALSTWVGSENITTLGTIATGVWEGTSIAVGYTDAKCVATWPDTYTADQNLLQASSPTFAACSLGTGELTCGSINRAADTLTLEINGTPEISITSTTVTLGGSLTGTTALFEGASVTVGKASTTTGTIVLHDSNSANTITLTVPDISAGSLTFTLPATDGDNTNVLQTNGSGVLSWAAAGGGATGYNDRGDPATSDFDVNDLTIDETWNDLDLSSIVGSIAALVHLRVSIYDDAVGKSFAMRENGNSNIANVFRTRAFVVSQYVQGDAFVVCDSSGVIEYWGTTGLDFVYITVAGWWPL